MQNYIPHTISLSGVTISGRHGATAIEKDVAQPFSVCADLTFNATHAINTELLEHTIDYYNIVTVIQEAIESTSFTLLESLVNHIADVLECTFLITNLVLTIQKTHIALQPKITIKRSYYSDRLTHTESFEKIHDAIVNKGIASTSFLSSEERTKLLAIAEKQTYKTSDPLPEKSLVREDLSYCEVNQESLPFRATADRIAQFLSEMESQVGHKLFQDIFTNKEVVLQKYGMGSIGITPHRDEKRNRGLVCIIPLKGSAKLALCDDRAGTNAMPVDTTPGNLILLRAPGYMGMTVRPMHFVSDITEERIVLGVRFIKE